LHTMHIDLDKEQFRELLLLVSAGNHVRRGARSAEEYSPDTEETLISGLYEMAYEAGIGDVEIDSKNKAEENTGAIIPTRNFEESVHTLIEGFSDSTFWHELSLLLAQRDLERSITPDERLSMELNGLELPSRLFELSERYNKEFETFGIDRLEINENAQVSDLRDVL